MLCQFVEIEQILSEVDDTCFGMYSCVLHEDFSLVCIRSQGLITKINDA